MIAVIMNTFPGIGYRQLLREISFQEGIILSNRAIEIKTGEFKDDKLKLSSEAEKAPDPDDYKF
jgi:hypothetical protein